MDLSKGGVLTLLRQVDEYEFEELVADLLEHWGWQTSVTPGSNDGGVDVVAEKRDPFAQTYVVQVKQYAPGNRIGSPGIQQYSSLRQSDTSVDGVVVLTTAGFTSSARDRAADLNVKLLDGDDVYEIVSEVGPADVLGEHLDLNSDTTVDQTDSSGSTASADSTTSSGSTASANREAEQAGVSPPPWFGPDLQPDSDVRYVADILNSFDMVAEQYGEILFGPAVLRRYSSCPECGGECFGAVIDYEGDGTEFRYCRQCRNLYTNETDSWRKLEALKF